MCRWDMSLLFERGEGQLVIKTYRSLISTMCLGASLTKEDVIRYNMPRELPGFSANICGNLLPVRSLL